MRPLPSPAGSRARALACVFALPHLAWLLAPGCVSRNRPHAPPPSTTAPATRAAASADANVDAPTPTSVEPSATSCTAVVRAPVHLRPIGVPQTVGPELPAGTTFEVLGVDPFIRRQIPYDEDEGVLARVRVAGTERTGWTFLRYTELAPACPLHVEGYPEAPVTTDDRAGHEGPAAWFALRGPRPRREQLLPCCRGAPVWEVLERDDIDGDGTRDEIVRVSRECMCPRTVGAGDVLASVVAFRRLERGWSATEVTLVEAARPEQASFSYGGTLRAGGALYFQTTVSGEYVSDRCANLPARVVHDTVTEELRRLHPTGAIVRVARLPPLLAGGCARTGLADGSVEVVCRRPERRLRLRWDADAFQLIPEGPAMPFTEHDGPLCRRTVSSVVSSRLCSNTSEPWVVTSPSTEWTSFTTSGGPSNGRASPRA